MFRHLISAFAIIFIATSAAAQPKVIRPGEQPAPRPEPPDLSELSLEETYRALDLFKYIGGGFTRGAVMARLLGAFEALQYDDDPALTQEDFEVRLSLEAAKARASTISRALAQDLDGDFVVTERELFVGGLQNATTRNRDVPLTAEQRMLLAQENVAKLLIYDVDGDRTLTLEELSASVDVEAMREQIRGRWLDAVWDVDGDGRIIEVELRRAADAALDLIDIDRDGLLAQQEVDLIRSALIRRKGQIDNPTRGKRVPCSLPEIPSAADIVVLQGERGSAVTDLAFDIPNRLVVRMSEVFVPARERPLYIMASMRNPTVFRLTGPGADKVAEVTSVAHSVAVLDGPRTRVRQTKCFVGFMGIRIKEPGGIEAEFERALGRRVTKTIAADTLGNVDLGTGRNDPNRRLKGDLLGNVEGDAKVVIDWLLSFDPGGYVQLDPRSLTAPVAVSKPEIPPLEIGLIALAGQGALEVVEGPGGKPVRRIRTGETEDRKKTSKSATAREGMDAMVINHLHVVARRYFEMPRGFDDEDRMVRVIVPEGVPPPRGLKRF